MRCAQCGTENDEGRRFCQECGTRLVPGCPTCGAENPPAAKFCGDCGTALGGGAAQSGTTARPTTGQAPTTPASPVAERRMVTVLFADLVGFTPYSEERDAEEVRETLGRYFDVARQVVERYGGTVEKFIGDAVMVVWGTPVSREDDAERAVRAGLELLDAVASLGEGLSLRAGVLTGEAAVTVGATDQGLVAGDLVNTASRLQAAAAPRTVLVGEATMRAASRAIAFEQAGEQALKGKAAPVPAWRALRVVAEVGGKGRAEGLEAPFVGRDTEFRLIKELFHATGRERRVRVVSITGQGGIGKSRLGWELEKYLDGLVETVRWHRGRSPAYGSGITFWALGEMVRMRCGLAELDDESTTRTRVSETVQDFVPDATEREWIEPALLALLGVGGALASGSEQLFPAWRTFFERIAMQGTVVMVFEDLQWADPGTVAFIDHMAGWSQGLPMFILTMARPDLLDTHPDWGTGHRGFTSMAVGPLDVEAMRGLLAGLVPGLPAKTSERIVARADGIPLYAVETVRMLLADGRLVLEDGVCRPVGDLSELEVPETLRSLIASRLDGLEPGERSVLQSAAVLGQTFTLSALAAVTGLSESELEPRLRALIRRETLTLRADPRQPERGQYAFAQALLREVAYSTLTREDRRTRHLAAARHFEGLGSDELAGALAVQYESAYRNSKPGPETEALGVQARLALKAAGERALALGSPEHAQGLFESAAAMASVADEQARLFELAGTAASSAAHGDDAERLLRRAIELHRANGDRSAAARATASLADAFVFTYRLEQAAGLLRPALDEFRDLEDDPSRVRLMAELARVEMLRQEDLDLAIAAADEALAIAERLDLVPVIADLLITRGSALTSVGRAYEGLGAIDAGRRLAAAHGLVRTQIRGLVNASAAMGNHDPREMMEASREALDLARRIGSRPQVLLAVNNLGEAARETGDWGLLLEEIERESAMLAVEGHTTPAYVYFQIRAERGEDVEAEIAPVRDWMRRGIEAGETELRASLLNLDAMVALPTGRSEAAIRAYREAAALDHYNAPWMYAEAAYAALLDRDANEAREILAALDGTGSHGAFVKLARRVAQAGIAGLEGRLDEARSGLWEARDAYRRMELARPLALSGLVAVAVLGPDDEYARAAAEEARSIWERLGAQAWLARLDELIGEASEGPADRVGDGAGRIEPSVATTTTGGTAGVAG